MVLALYSWGMFFCVQNLMNMEHGLDLETCFIELSSPVTSLPMSYLLCKQVKGHSLHAVQSQSFGVGKGIESILAQLMGQGWTILIVSTVDSWVISSCCLVSESQWALLIKLRLFD